MKNMKISIKNEEKLAAAIVEAEGRSTARTVTVHDIKNVLEKVGEDIGLPKSVLHGTKVHYDGGEHFPSAYKYRPESTHWTAENVRGNWYITSIYRSTCPNRRRNTVIEYSDAAKEKIIENLSNRWC